MTDLPPAVIRLRLETEREYLEMVRDRLVMSVRYLRGAAPFAALTRSTVDHLRRINARLDELDELLDGRRSRAS